MAAVAKWLAVVIVTLAAGAMPADAAVRICLESVSSGPHAAATVAQGQRLAIDAWVKAARKAGDEYVSWRLALTKSLTCTPAADKGVVCEARGIPCTIMQAPPSDRPAIKPTPPEPKIITVPPAKSIKA